MVVCDDNVALGYFDHVKCQCIVDDGDGVKNDHDVVIFNPVVLRVYRARI